VNWHFEVFVTGQERRLDRKLTDAERLIALDAFNAGAERGWESARREFNPRSSDIDI
jgi:hypothetical protein